MACFTKNIMGKFSIPKEKHLGPDQCRISHFVNFILCSFYHSCSEKVFYTDVISETSCYIDFMNIGWFYGQIFRQNGYARRDGCFGQ